MDDLISRQAAIDALRDAENHAFNSFYQGLVKAHKIIADMPSAQPEPQWIPCSERLPEKPNMYTVTDSKGDVVRFVFTSTESSRKYWQRCAKAWMPLPEPYKGETNGKNV